jgi:hypothetical protein
MKPAAKRTDYQEVLRERARLADELPADPLSLTEVKNQANIQAWRNRRRWYGDAAEPLPRPVQASVLGALRREVNQHGFLHVLLTASRLVLRRPQH